MAQQILLAPQHSQIVDDCRQFCREAVTYYADGQDFRASQLMAQAYRKRNKFPISTYAYRLCQSATQEAENEMFRENRHNLTRDETIL